MMKNKIAYIEFRSLIGIYLEDLFRSGVQFYSFRVFYGNYKLEEFIKNLGSIELIEFSYISVQPSCRVCIIGIKSLIGKNETISLNLRKQLFLFHKGLDSFKWIENTDQLELEFDKLTKHFGAHDEHHVCFYVDNKLCWTVSDDLHAVGVSEHSDPDYYYEEDYNITTHYFNNEHYEVTPNVELTLLNAYEKIKKKKGTIIENLKRSYSLQLEEVDLTKYIA